MTTLQPMYRDIDWPKLIALLRKTYNHGDGGLPQESGIDSGVLSRCTRGGVYSYENGVTLWNIGIRKVAEGKLTHEELFSCTNGDVG